MIWLIDSQLRETSIKLCANIDTHAGYYSTTN